MDTTLIKGDPVFQLAHRADVTVKDARISERLTSFAVQDEHKNINGPLIIRIPLLVQNPLGKYYRYFAHHKSDLIRMTYS